ncbi:MAG: hypothetical protein COS90_04080 [Deltaproteobacteria bacterium CG07_land_8_20_14_0_80_60_11]|nr:MAG: hypothetical protein COS90_04080 [Deltaproteobacteria bacterium CG07_land_8_20_14_0_80_60_11]
MTAIEHQGTGGGLKDDFSKPGAPVGELAEASSIYQILPPPVRKSRLKGGLGAKFRPECGPGLQGLDTPAPAFRPKA